MKPLLTLYIFFVASITICGALIPKSTKVVNTYRVFGDLNNAVCDYRSVSEIYKFQMADDFNRISHKHTLSFTQQKNAWNATHGIGQAKIRCLTNTECICGAGVQYDDQDIQNTISIIDIEVGEYSLIP
jgi:hypothetical protein